MTISRQNLTIIIVSFISDNVIHDCIKSISKDLNIIIVDNSNNKKFKDIVEKKYENVTCILSSENIGMGAGNNLGIKHLKTDYAFILNPDVTLEIDTIDEIIKGAQKIKSFGILAPLSNDENYPNYKVNIKKNTVANLIEPFRVNSVDGFAMVINIKKLRSLNNFKNHGFFDENFFMYLENDDICKRVIEENENIYVVPKSKINHIGASAVDQKYNHQVELSRNWHWIWSKFYYQKKHNNYLVALINGFPTFLSAILKCVLYLLIFNTKKRAIYFYRAMGYLNALLGRKSYYRPKIKI